MMTWYLLCMAMEDDPMLAILLPAKGWDYRHHAYKSRFELGLSMFRLPKQSTEGRVNLP